MVERDDWLDEIEIEAELSGQAPHYVARLIAEIRRLRSVLESLAENIDEADRALRQLIEMSKP
jgi:hypothetical protein